MPADLVVDATGRNTPVPGMLEALDVPGLVEERTPRGFRYYTRHFHSTDGSPELPAFPLEHHETISTIALPGDSGTWSLVLGVSAWDKELRALHDAGAWHRAVALFPSIAHWADGVPITGVQAMAGTETRHRTMLVDGNPVVTGLLSVGDAWATTNPMFGLGISMGLVHAAALRDVVRELGLDEPHNLALRFDEVAEDALMPFYRFVRDWDRHRLAEIEAEIAAQPAARSGSRRHGSPYEPDDDGWTLGNALNAAKLSDPDLLRALADMGSMLVTPEAVIGRSGMVETIIATGGGSPRYPGTGPSRADLLTAIGAF